MADNYLEKRYEEVFLRGNGAGRPARRPAVPSLNTLLVKNRSIRRWRQDFAPPYGQLMTVVGVNAHVASAMNRQGLRFHIVTASVSPEKVEVLRAVLFREEMRPYAATSYIIVFSTVPGDKYTGMDLGISLQSMALKAVELGLNCLIKGNIDPDRLMSVLSGDLASGNCPYMEPVAVLCLGKADESVFLKPVMAGEDIAPYTKDGVRYVPKIRPEDLVI